MLSCREISLNHMKNKLDINKAMKGLLKNTHPDVRLVLFDELDDKPESEIVAHLQRVHHCGTVAAQALFNACDKEIEEMCMQP